MSIPQEVASFKCPLCFLQLKNAKSLYQHKTARCQVKLWPGCDQPDLEVKPIEEEKSLLRILHQTKPSFLQLLNIQKGSGTAFPGLAPLFFPTSKHFPPIYHHIGCVENSYFFLEKAALEGPGRLKKRLTVKLGEKVIQLSHNLLPCNARELKNRKLKVMEKRDHVVVYHISDESQVRISVSNLGKLSNRKSNEIWKLVQSGDDPPPPPKKINLGLF